MEIFNEIVREVVNTTNKSINKATSSIGFEFATITSTGFKLDTFKHEIQDYMVLDYLKLENEYNNLKKLKEGDRVLVVSVCDEFVVVGRVVNA